MKQKIYKLVNSGKQFKKSVTVYISIQLLIMCIQYVTVM